MRIIKEWFNGLSNTGRVIVVSAIAVLSVGGMNALAQPSVPSEFNESSNTAQSTKQVHSPKIEKRTLTTTEPVKFSSSTIEDPALESGLTQTRVAGVDGIKTHYFDVTYTDGVETKRDEVKSEVTTAVINEVIAKGTKVTPPPAPAASCPNGTYVNTYGNTVCSPAYSSTVPSGATAECVDGTYSYSQSRRGTCSHHGGVANWL